MADDETMTRRGLVWAGTALLVAALIGLGAYFATVGLDKADKWASVIGVFIAIIGLAVAVAGLFTGQNTTEQAPPQVSASGERSVAIGGDNTGTISTGDGTTNTRSP
ncbi:hypothetical protein [uncultured Thermomonospora sp.]|uniref:hypothetical protein n=1 Tax=uncultured Thermomonospora sp. TaxID=671175 RepID=UPI00259B1884|nr:hypothetical protein [uncultured Thermomonospora sp.]